LHNILEVSSFLIAIDKRQSGQRATPRVEDGFHACALSDIRDCWLSWCPRLLAQSDDDGTGSPPITLVLGDAQDYRAEEKIPYMGCASCLCHDAANGTISISSSIMGLPPVFVYRSEKLLLIASSVHLIADYPGIALHFDPQGLTDLATIGFPLDGRTLFTEVSVLEAGNSLIIDHNGILRDGPVWQPATLDVPTDASSQLEQLTDLFNAAVARMDVSRSFLSLTAGIDTRAIFATLQQQGKGLPAYTIRGRNESIDSRRALELCNAYQLQFTPVTLDSEFTGQLPELAVTASRLSGGIASIHEAADVYMYKCIDSRLKARVSGNIGNQLGRGGSEGTSSRNATLSLLNPVLVDQSRPASKVDWMLSRTGEAGLHPRFLIQHENMYAMLGNCGVGTSFATQQVPYADRTLIETRLCQQFPTSNQSASVLAIKFRDLRHRFLGPSRDSSFQLRAISRSGGALAQIPVNWGWRPSGGISLSGAWLGGCAMAEILLGSRAGFSTAFELLNMVGLSEFRNPQDIYRSRCRDFISDLLRSTPLRESGVFDSATLDNLRGTAFADQSRYTDLVFATDIAIAVQNFRASS